VAHGFLTLCPHRTLQVSQLLTACMFQQYSGPVLEVLSLQPQDSYCFDFAAPPEAYPVSCMHVSACAGGWLRVLLVVRQLWRMRALGALRLCLQHTSPVIEMLDCASLL
jgi:hypothetical protein